MSLQQSAKLPDNPLKQFTTYNTYFTIKVGRRLKSNAGKGGDVPANGHETASLLIDTRGQAFNPENNKHPRFSIRGFEINHFMNMDGEVTFGIDATLNLFERGGLSYLQSLGEKMQDLGISNTAELVLWVGVGFIGWKQSGNGFISEQLPQKWFPCQIFKITTSMRSSGSEYTHWLRGWTYYRSGDSPGQRINTTSTRGITVEEHLTNLIEEANKQFQESKKEGAENPIDLPKNAQADTFKTIEFSFSFPAGAGGVIIDKSAPVDSDAVSQDKGGVITISSGGRAGHTTMVNHIKQILIHSPSIMDTLRQGKLNYKVIAQVVEMGEDKEKINYSISPYDMDGTENQPPIKNFVYFFGGRNEDILEFDFTIDGLFQILAQGIAASGRDQVNPTKEVTTSGTKATGGDAEKSGIVKEPRNPQAQETTDALTGQNRKEIIGPGLFPVLPTKVDHYTDLPERSAKAFLAHKQSVEKFVGIKLGEQKIKILGDPNLILDEPTIARLEFERGVQYVTFKIGTPLPDFPTVPAHDNFVFNGIYSIRNIKSIITETGSFVQELDVYYRADLSHFLTGPRRDNRA